MHALSCTWHQTLIMHMPKVFTETAHRCTFTSAGKDALKLDTFPRTLARQAVTGSVANAKMSLQGGRWRTSPP